MKVEVFDKVDADWWNGLLKMSPHANIYQTAEWASWLRYVFNAHIKFVICLDDNGKISAQGICSSMAPFSFLYSGRQYLNPLAKAGRRISPEVNWLHGPVMHCKREMWDKVVNGYFFEVKSMYKLGSICRVTLPHEVTKSINWENLYTYVNKRWATFLVNLEIPTEEIWKNFKSSARKNLRKLEDSGIEVSVVDDLSDLKGLYPDFSKWTKRMGGRLFEWEYWETRFNLLKSIKAERYYVAFLNGDPLGCLGVWQFGPMAFEFGALQSSESLKNRTNCHDLIKWSIFQREKERGVKCYDLTGVNPQPSSKKEENIFQFKKKWGGAYVEYPIFKLK